MVKRKIMPPTYFYLGIVLIILMHFIFPLIQLIRYPYTLIGILFIIFGTTLNIFSWLLFIKNKTTQNPFKKPDKLIMQGVYKISRNPMYLGMLLGLIGLCILLGSLITFIFPIIFFIILEKLFIPIEEESMKRTFGNYYIKYKNKVRRWI